MKCVYCQHENPDGITVCAKCGAPIPEQTNNQPQAQQYQQPVQPNQQVTNPYQQQAPAQNPVGYNGMPPQPPYVKPADDKNKKTKLAIILAVAGVIVVAIIALVVISLSGSSGTSTNDIDITNNFYYKDLEQALIDNQNAYMKNGRVPDNKMSELIEEQYTFIDQHRIEYNIIDITQNDDTIDVDFDDGSDWTYDPTNYYDLDDDSKNESKTTSSSNSNNSNSSNEVQLNSVAQSLSNNAWEDVSMTDASMGEQIINISFNDDGTFSSTVYNLIGEYSTNGKYKIDGDQVKLTVKISDDENISYSFYKVDGDKAFASYYSNGKNFDSLFVNDNLLSKDNSAINELDDTHWQAPYLFDEFSEQGAELFNVFASDYGDSLDAELSGYHGTTLEFVGYADGSNIVAFDSSNDDGDSYVIFMFLNGDEANTIIFKNGKFATEETWTK